MDRPVNFINSNFIRTLIVLDIVIIIFLIIFNLSPFLTENLYSRGLYPILSLVMGKITDIVFFSITEIILVSFVLFLLVRFIITIYRLVKRHRTFKNIGKHFLKQTFILFSFIFIIFYFMWGFNYYRLPMEIKTETIKVESKIDKNLFNETLSLFIKKANDLYMSNITRTGYPFEKVNTIINQELHKTLKNLEDIDINPANKCKISLANLIEFSNSLGVISPFLLESHISKELIYSELPFILAHEKSHLYGYANETEANYIAFITCINSDNDYLQYSAYTQILRYFLLEYKRNHTEEEYKELYKKLDDGIRKEYSRQYQRYQKYNTAFSKNLYKLYNIYLRTNNVPEGVKSYSRVVQMILRSDILFDIMEESELENEDIIIPD